MSIYSAYGLTLACEFPLPFAQTLGGAAVDATIRPVLGGKACAPAPSLERELGRNGSDWSLRYRNSAGDWLHFDYAAAAKVLTILGSVDWESAIPPLVGVACAVLLSSMGIPLLHGAAVGLDGEAIAILGCSGRGKSTLAAALLKTGGRLLSEDLLAFSRGGDDFEIEPGYCRISLLPDSTDALGMRTTAGAAPGSRAGTNKSWMETVPPAGALRLRRIFILEPPDPASPTGLSQMLHRSTATPALVQHLYGASWIRPRTASDLAFCAALAANVPVFSLSRGVSLEDVEACAAMLLDAQPASIGPS